MIYFAFFDIYCLQIYLLSRRAYDLFHYIFVDAADIEYLPSHYFSILFIVLLPLNTVERISLPSLSISLSFDILEF
jgi:hypothetical protein